MMAKSTKFLCLVLALAAGSTHASGTMELGNRALSLEVRGKNGGFDSVAYEETRHQISSFIADGTVDHFVVYRYYANGGFAACIELAITSLASRLREIRERFLGIRYDPSNTAYFVGPEKRCR